MRDIEEAISCIRLTLALVPFVRQAKSHEAHINVVSYSLWTLVEELGLDDSCNDHDVKRLVDLAGVLDGLEHRRVAVYDTVTQDDVPPPKEVLTSNVLRSVRMDKHASWLSLAHTQGHRPTTAHGSHDGRLLFAEQLVPIG